MATEVGNIHIGLYVDVGQTSRFSDVASVVETSSRRMNTALGNTTNAVRSLRTQMGQNLRLRLATDSLKGLSQATDEVGRLRAAIVGITAITGGGITGAFGASFILQTADKYKLLGNQIATVTDSTADLSAVQDGLYQVSQRTRSSLEATTQIYARTARATQQYGTSQQNLLRITETVQKAFAIGGATPEEASGAALQLSQGIASNKFGGDEYRSVAENAPVLLKGIADSLGVDLGKLRKMSTEGQLTAQVVTNAILKSSEAIDKAFAKTVPTVAQSFTLIDNAFLRYVGETDKAYGGTKALSGEMKSLADNFDEVMYWITRVTGGLAALYAARTLVVGTQRTVAGIQSTNAGIRSNISDYVDENNAIQKRLDAVNAQIAAAKAAPAAAEDAIAIKQSQAINAAKEKEFLAQKNLNDLEAQRNVVAGKLTIATNDEIGKLQKQVEVQRELVRDAQLRVIQAQEAAAAEERNLQAKKSQSVTKAGGLVETATGNVSVANSRVADTAAAIEAEKQLAKVRLANEIDARQQSLVTQTQRLRQYQAEIAELRSIQDLEGFTDTFGKQYTKLLGQQQSALIGTSKLRSEITGLQDQLDGIDSGTSQSKGITAAMNAHAKAVKAAETAVKALAAAEANRDKIAASQPTSQSLQSRLTAEAKSIDQYQKALDDLQTKMLALRDASNQAFTGKGATKLASQLDALDAKISVAQGSLKTASSAVGEAQGGNVQMLNEALAAQEKAAKEVNSLQEEAALLLERQVVTTEKLAVSQKSLNVLRRAGNGILDFFGGGIGLGITVALTAATVLMAKFAADSAESAQQTENITKQLTDLGYLTGKASDDMKSFKDDVTNIRISKLQEEFKGFQGDVAKTVDSLKDINLKNAVPDTAPSAQADIFSAPVLFDSIFNKQVDAAHDASKKIIGSLTDVRDEIVKNKSMSDEARKSLEQMALANPDLSSIVMQLIALGERLNALKKASDDWLQGIKDAAAKANAQPSFRETENASMDSLSKMNAANQPMLDKQLRDANLDEYETQVQEEEKKILAAAQKLGNTISLSAARVQAEELIAAQTSKKGLLDLIGFYEGTDKTGNAYNTTLGNGKFTGGEVNLTQMSIDQVLDLQKKMLANPDNTLNSSAVGRYQITRQTLLDFMKQLNISGDTAFDQSTQDRIAEAIIRSTGGDISKLRGRWTGLANAPDNQISTASNKTFSSLPQYDENTKKWIDGLQGLDLTAKVKGLNDLDQQVISTAQSMGASKEDVNQYIAAVTSGKIDEIPAKFKAIADALKGGIDNEFLKQLKELKDNESIKFLSDLQQKVIDTARQFGASEPEVKAYVDAITDGRLDQVPVKFALIQQQLEKTASNDRIIEFADGLAESFGNVFTNIENGDSVWKGLVSDLEKLVVQVLIVEPLVDRLKTSFRSLGSTISGGGGGFLSSLFGGGSSLLSSLTSPSFKANTTLGAFLGFDDGGWTGPGAKKKPVGVVHADEFVFDKDTTNKAGVGNLEGIRRFLKSGGSMSDLMSRLMPQYDVGGFTGTSTPSVKWPPASSSVAANSNKMVKAMSTPSGTNDNLHITVGVDVDESGNLKGWVKNIARAESADVSKRAVTSFSHNVLPDRLNEIKRNPNKRGGSS